VESALFVAREEEEEVCGEKVEGLAVACAGVVDGEGLEDVAEGID